MGCEFQPVVCPHQGCQERCSSKDLEAHDQICPHKPIACKKCKEMIPRSKHRVHAMAVCPNREARCTFSCIGCEVPVQHCDLEKHLDDSTQGHLMLLMRALMEQKELVSTLSSRVEELGAACAEANEARKAEEKKNTALAAQVAGLEAKLAAFEQKSAQDLRKSCDAVSSDTKKKTEAMEKETKKRLEAAEKNHKSDLGTLWSDVASFKKSHSELGKVQADVKELKESLQQVRSGFATAAGSTPVQPGAQAGA